MDTELQPPDVEIDLLPKPKVKSPWVPRIICGQKRWKVFSGAWQVRGPCEMVLLQEPQMTNGENIAVIGSKRWRDYRFEATLMILNDSLKPPEGGAILYYHFQNANNYRSLHVCIAKRRLELIKRRKGVWTTIAEQEFPVEKLRKYRIGVITSNSRDKIQIDGDTRLEVKGSDDLCGYVGVGAKYCNLLFTAATLSLIYAPSVSKHDSDPGE